MSRIIKEGKLPTRRMICAACGCEFEYTKRDVKKIYHSLGRYYSAADRLFYDDYVLCPCCDSQIMILPQKKSEEVKNSNFMEDVRALAKQYGYKIDSIELSNNN